MRKNLEGSVQSHIGTRPGRTRNWLVDFWRITKKTLEVQPRAKHQTCDIGDTNSSS